MHRFFSEMVYCLILLAVLAQTVIGNHVRVDVNGLTIHEVECEYDQPNCRCRPDADVCEFELELEARMTLTRYAIEEEVNERGVAGTIYYFDDPSGELLPLPPPLTDQICANVSLEETERCTPPNTADGATFRPYIAINGLFPGPNLIVYYNQTLSVLVVNRLEQESASMHWHGLHQNNTPWMDGVDHVTQCGILPGASFRYIFKAIPSGTFWYHSHTGVQRTDGMFGALVILERNIDDVRQALRRHNAALENFRDEPENHTLSILEWFPQTTLNFFPALDSGNRFFQQTPPRPSDLPFFGDVAPDGAENGNLYFFSGLINGRGKHPNDTLVPYNMSRLSIFTVEPGEVYRFRLIGAQGLFLFRFSIDEHQLDVMATDGYLTEPITADYILIHSGERYDFILRAKEMSEVMTKNNFIIRAEVLVIDVAPFPTGPPPGPAPYPIIVEDRIEAILHYNIPGSNPPVSTEYEEIARNSIPHSTVCTQDSPCHAVNCPLIFHPSYNITCTFIDQFRLLFPAPEDELPLNAPESDNIDDGGQIFFNFAVDGFGPHNSINGRRLRFPSEPVQLLTPGSDELRNFVEREVCRNVYDRELCRNSINTVTSPECNCAQVNPVPNFLSTTRFVLSNLGPQGDFAHPIHLHGHSFFVLEIGFPEYNDTTGLKGCHNDSLNCFVPENVDRCGYVGQPPLSRDYTCNNPEWRPGMEPFYGPPTERIDARTVRKDTVTVPAGGYAVIQFLADNPGYWIMHCHVETHTLEGMATVINEAEAWQTPPPDGMRICGNFTWELSDFYDRINHPGPRATPPLCGAMVSVATTAAVFLSVILALLMA